MKTLLSALAAAVLLSSCANLAAGSTDRPNSYQNLQSGQRDLSRQDPYNHLDQQTQSIDLSKDPKQPQPKTCTLPCVPGEHCDASGPVERCISDAAKP